MNKDNDKLLIIKLGDENFWHRRNNTVLTDRNISDFEVSINDYFTIVELDGSQNWSYLVENVSIQIGSAAIEKGFNRFTLKNRLTKIGYTPYLSNGDLIEEEQINTKKIPYGQFQIFGKQGNVDFNVLQIGDIVHGFFSPKRFVLAIYNGGLIDDENNYTFIIDNEI